MNKQNTVYPLKGALVFKEEFVTPATASMHLGDVNHLPKDICCVS